MALADALTALAPPGVPGRSYGSFARVEAPVEEVPGETLGLEVSSAGQLTLELSGAPMAMALHATDALVLEVN
jgi:hypothetical protein